VVGAAELHGAVVVLIGLAVRAGAEPAVAPAVAAAVPAAATSVAGVGSVGAGAGVGAVELGAGVARTVATVHGSPVEP